VGQVAPAPPPPPLLLAALVVARIDCGASSRPGCGCSWGPLPEELAHPVTGPVWGEGRGVCVCVRRGVVAALALPTPFRALHSAPPASARNTCPHCVFLLTAAAVLFLWLDSRTCGRGGSCFLPRHHTLWRGPTVLSVIATSLPSLYREPAPAHATFVCDIANGCGCADCGLHPWA
jgi:hypothetical protein